MITDFLQTACGGDGTSVATRFDSSFCNGGIQRLLCVNTLDVIDVVEAVFPEWHQVLKMYRSTLKWGDLVLPATHIPTTSNPDCTKCDTQPNPCSAGTVGTYEGAYYYHY